MSNKVWYVTGASQGLGLTLVKQLLAAGYRVAATSRNTDKLKKAVGGEFPQFLPLDVDLTNSDSIRKSIEKTVQTFGTIDVIVNNAGYGINGTVEELEEKQMRDIFEINVFATITVTKYALPYLRKQRSGHIINISSVAGFVGSPGWSVYSATKAAVIGFSEVLALDVHALGIKVTVVGPSLFRTGFLSGGSLVSVATHIDDYRAVTEAQARYAVQSGKENGDPEKAAALFIQLAEDAEPPLHLWLGSNAIDRASAKLRSMDEELNKWKDLSISADFQ
jgi:short-subunit dehydrogenase